MYKNAELNPLHLNEDHIGFQITPRLNAVGRLADANIMVEFLMTRDEGRARVLATQIEGLNAKRRFITRQVKKAAEAQLQASPEDRHAPAIVLHHPQWPGGVVGIVAGNLAERYHKPVIILTGENPIHGSARSIEGIHITDAIASQAELLVGYGGHPMAAGLSLSPKHLYAFKQGFLSAIETQTKLGKIVPELHIHQTITLDEIDINLVEEIGRLAPFGSGNSSLHFMLQDLSLLSATSVGQHGEHRQILAEDEQENQQRFIWWNGREEHMPEAHFDLVCALSQSDYKGALQVSAEWIDYRLSAKGRQEVEKRHFTITDLRNTPTPVSLCENMLSQYPNAKIWGEGVLQKGINGLGRDELDAVDTLIIWTIPPSQSVLQEVLQKVQPRHVIVFSQDPNIDSHKTFMERLAGLAKFAIKYKDNQVELDRFAVACAVEWETIRLGLQLWEARGKLRVHFSGDSVFIKAENTLPDLTSIEIYEPILTAMLEEHRAFRRFFKTGEINSLLGQDIV